MSADPTKRFSDRVDNYVKYRPGYPIEVIDLLENECGLSAGSAIADIGAGTGIFTELLLNRKYKVYAVEPNADMLNAARQQLGGYENFIPANGNAEATSLLTGSIDLVVCAQAFHWFNNERTKVEFKRILKEDAFVALIWNNRLADVDGFSIAYENLLKQGATDYNQVNHRNISNIDFEAFFRNGKYKAVKYPNVQVFDEDGFLGRAFSSSYVPSEGTGDGKQFRKILKDMFAQYNKNGRVSFHYQTETYLGKL